MQSKCFMPTVRCGAVYCGRRLTDQPAHVIVIVLSLLLTMLGGVPTTAQETRADGSPVPELKAKRVNPQPPKIDGVLDDKIWRSAGMHVARGFTQREPDDGKAAAESTVVAVAYDDEALYVAYWCYDSQPDKILRHLVRRDHYSESDYIVVRLDPYHDHRTGYQFTLTAAGVQRDYRLYNDDHSDNSWDAVWEGDVRIQPWGWSAEFKIPYYCLRFSEGDDQVWGLDFARYHARNSESSRWAYTPTSVSGLVSNFGHLTGLTDIRSGRHVELLPYAVSSLETESKHIGNPDGSNVFGDVGFDVKYCVASNLVLNAAINPDFGQVELDRPVLNLSAFETWYSERRPFFVEGANMFNTRFDLFYSRRVGRSPTGWVNDDFYLDRTSRPKATTILGAAKLNGRLANGTSIAVLTAVTDEEKEEYLIDSAGAQHEREAVIEPKASYSVVRLNQEILANSTVGAMFTLASQDTRHPSLTGGVDWRLRTNSNTWYFNGQAVFSRNDGENVGYGVDCSLGKDGGAHWRGALGFEIEDRYLNINKLGFLGRNDYRDVWTWIQYRTTNDWWIVRNSWNNFNSWLGWNTDGNNISRGWNVNSTFELTNNWSIYVQVAHNFNEYDDMETRGNGLWREPVNWRWWFFLDTDTRKKISFGWHPDGGFYRDAWWWAQQFSITYRPASNMEFDIWSRYSQDYGQIWWVTNPGDGSDPVFANMNQHALDIGFTAAVVPHRNLSLQLSARGLLTSLDYYNYRPYSLSGGYGSSVDGYEADYNYTALNSTFLIRWEYVPGSTLYLVWTRSRPEVDYAVNDFDLSRDFRRFFSAGADNVFLIKASYWLHM